MKPYILPLFLLNFVSFLLVVLVTFSAPFSDLFYFLQAPTAGGFTRFGLLGWQETPSGASVGPQIGYYAPQLTNWLTYSLVLTPISGILCVFTLITLVAQMANCDESLPTTYPTQTSTHAPRSTPETLFSWTTYLNLFISLAAFVFSLALFVAAHEQFRLLGAAASTNLAGSGGVDNGPAAGGSLQYGPCLWMQATSLTVVLFTPVIRAATRAWSEKKRQSAALGGQRQSVWKVKAWG